jgi:hypothetical protein
MKSEGLAQLRELALQASRWKHPTMPEEWRCTHNYTDKTANGLTKCILDWCRFNGYQAERIAVTGRYIDNTKVVSDTLGFKRKIGTGKWIKGSMQKGSADLSIIIRGHAIKAEIKIKDKQSPDQVEYQRQVEQAGGLYWLCHNFDEFLNYFNELK